MDYDLLNKKLEYLEVLTKLKKDGIGEYDQRIESVCDSIERDLEIEGETAVGGLTLKIGVDTSEIDEAMNRVTEFAEASGKVFDECMKNIRRSCGLKP